MLKFAICVVGIYTCFLTWGYYQERISTISYGNQKFKYFIFLNVIQSLFASVIAFLYLWVTGRSLGRPDRSLQLKYLQVAVLNTIASPFGYMSLKHIDYPTMVLGKSCKLVPVMLMNIMLYRKKFPLYKYITVVLITVGVSGFMLLEPRKEGSRQAANSLLGLALLTVNLLIDGATNSTQDHIFHSFRVTGQGMMFYMNVLGCMLMFTWLLNPWNPELAGALAFVGAHPAILMDVGLFALSNSIGQCFIFYTLEHYGSLSLVTVNVTRKLFTILLSVFSFEHHLSFGQWVSVALVFLGIGLEAYVKQREKIARQQGRQAALRPHQE